MTSAVVENPFTATRTREWLWTLLSRIPRDAVFAPRALCHVLVASWIAEQISPEDGSNFHETATYVAHQLNSAKYLERDDVKPTMMLLVDVVLHAEGVAVEPFRDFLHQTVSILASDDETLDGNRPLAEKHLLLHGVGLLPAPAPPTATRLQAMLAGVTLSASTDAIEALALETEYVTGWGTRPFDGECAGLADLFGGLAVQHVRTYDLVAAARLIRLAQYVAFDRAAVHRPGLYEQLRTHHRRHGPFGWYGPEAARLAQEAPAQARDRDVLVDVELHLPATLECLWTMAEGTSNGWRLFDRLPPYAPRPTEAVGP